MDRQAARKVLEDIDSRLRSEREKAIQNALCFYPGCTETPIHSHVISKKLLKRIAENSHVLTWLSSETSLSDMADAFDAGENFEHLDILPVLVSIGKTEKITYPLFCHPHDERVFKQIEKRELAAYDDRIPKQILLLAYRALCSSMFQLMRLSPVDAILDAVKESGYPHSLSEPEKYRRLYRLMAKDVMLSVYKRYEQIRMSGDYSQLGYGFYVVNVPPCIATTYTFIPMDDITAVLNGTRLLNPEDAVCFTFLPHEPLTSSICVMSWLKASQNAHQFMALNRINDLPDKKQQELFFRFTFESPTVYISPQWWNSLSGEKRYEYTMIHFNAGKEHAELV